ncbi:MAG: hypothetical protein GWO00_19025, partial [Gemmatimonadetes bacterium]|nr:hypothetical protein [Gemmatimonadota bacterium]NIR80374.1 hypothetical protein [Gemmatimonadota bacterium]NIU32934.1 hypothetical protein [Gemmatimonadota bacterium]NIU37333.1 hypothetical protein [Gemmatimonadota bacterium]NIV59647.1 hypothetical protein [Gemmatimonadota bacterium]
MMRSGEGAWVRTSRLPAAVGAAAALLLAGASPAPGQSCTGTEDGQWRYWGGDTCSSRF